MTTQEAIGMLNQTGHLEYPFGNRRGVPVGYSLLSLDDPFIQKALASFQDFGIQHLEPLCLKHHKRSAHCDGEHGPATDELMHLKRCGCCDYGEDTQSAIGTGSWKGCHGIGDFHAATVKVHPRGMPSFLEPKFEQIWDNIVAAFDAMGLRLIRTEDEDANINFRFETGRTNWIGLAEVASGLSCTSKMWCKYSALYRPADIVNSWTILGLHEFFHNCSGRHTRTGIMSPVLSPRLQPTWIGDPSEPIIRKLFGGKPIPSDDPPEPPPVPPPTGHGIIRMSDNEEFDALAGPYMPSDGSLTLPNGDRYNVRPRAKVPGQ